MHSSRNIKAWQHLAGTPKQPTKSKTQIAFAQLVSTSIRLQTKQTRHSPHKYKGTLKKNKQRLYTQHHQRGSKQQTPTQNETTPQFRGCQTLLGKLEQSGKCQIMTFWWLISTQHPNSTSTKKGVTHTVTTKQGS